MFAELWRYWTTFAPERVRKFGYLQRLIALEFRHKRCAEAWAPHLQRCRNIITKAADLCEKQNTCVVLGSGLLLEVPVSALASRFETVYLVDIFHMPSVQAEAKKHFNVKLLTGDITGVFQAMKERKAPGPNQPAPPPRIPHLKDADFIVSCNCLTQLAGPFTQHFEKERGFSDLDSDKVAFQMMEKHAQAIAVEATGVGVLITDVERDVMVGDRVVTRTDLLKAFKLPETPTHLHNEEWDWLIAPAPEEDPARDIVHIVEAKVYQRNLDEKKEGEAAEGSTPPELDDRFADASHAAEPQDDTQA
ncbi:MAG: hypothetical protein JNM81_02250 [Rhodospirillaceae bacterium]|nr:hypothetical protein [Rhodospirillaceae bacterium]